MLAFKFDWSISLPVSVVSSLLRGVKDLLLDELVAKKRCNVFYGYSCKLLKFQVGFKLRTSSRLMEAKPINLKSEGHDSDVS